MKKMNSLIAGIGLSFVLTSNPAYTKDIQILQEVTMPKNIEQEKIKEYKRLFLKDKTLKKLFTPQELEQRIRDNLIETKIVRKLGGNGEERNI